MIPSQQIATEKGTGMNIYNRELENRNSNQKINSLEEAKDFFVYYGKIMEIFKNDRFTPIIDRMEARKGAGILVSFICAIFFLAAGEYIYSLLMTLFIPVILISGKKAKRYYQSLCDMVEEYKNCSILDGMTEEEALRYTEDFIMNAVTGSEGKPVSEMRQYAREMKDVFGLIIVWLLMIGGIAVAYFSFVIVSENVISNDGIIGIMIGIGILLFTIGRQLKDNQFILGSNLEKELVQYQQYYMDHFRTQTSETEEADSGKEDDDAMQRFTTWKTDANAGAYQVNDFSRIGEEKVYFEHIKTLEEAKTFYPFFGTYLEERMKKDAPRAKGYLMAQIAIDLIDVFAGVGSSPLAGRYTADAVRGVQENSELATFAESCMDLSILKNMTEEESIKNANELIDIYNEVQFKHDYGEERLKVLKNVDSVMSSDEQVEMDSIIRTDKNE